jgi:hypothetical protein
MQQANQLEAEHILRHRSASHFWEVSPDTAWGCGVTPDCAEQQQHNHSCCTTRTSTGPKRLS